MKPEPLLQHRLGCQHPDVHVTRGVTKTLTTCRTCGASMLTPKLVHR